MSAGTVGYMYRPIVVSDVAAPRGMFPWKAIGSFPGRFSYSNFFYLWH
jgi:hypothetical protein